MYRLLIPHIKPSVREIMNKSHWDPGLYCQSVSAGLLVSRPGKFLKNVESEADFHGQDLTGELPAGLFAKDRTKLLTGLQDHIDKRFADLQQSESESGGQLKRLKTD